MSDYVEVLAEHHRTARKKHQCQTCWRPINPGDKYLEQRNALDGRVYAWRTHHDCHAAYWSWQPDDGYGDLADFSEGHLPPCPLAWMNRQDEACTCEAKP